uniref:Uncharacterized protein n=1 Tax=Rhizophora mucronata TaxID=61149 RepID=A0A2P2M484_RHIMU
MYKIIIFSVQQHNIETNMRRLLVAIHLLGKLLGGGRLECEFPNFGWPPNYAY